MARAHLEIADPCAVSIVFDIRVRDRDVAAFPFPHWCKRTAIDFRERAEILSDQLWVLRLLTHAWPRASSAAWEARRDARGGAGAISRAGASADEGARAP